MAAAASLCERRRHGARLSPDGKQLYSHDADRNTLFVVDVHTEQGLKFGSPVRLPIEGALHPQQQRNYDVAPDGKRLLVVLPARKTPEDPSLRAPRQLNVVLNWFEELRARAPVR